MARIFWIPGHPRPQLAVVLCPIGGRKLYDEMREFKRVGVHCLGSIGRATMPLRAPSFILAGIRMTP